MENQNLGSLVAQANTLELAIIEAGGELSPELEAALQQIDVSIASKVEGYAFVMDRLESVEATWDLKAQKLAQISKSVRKARETIRNRLKAVMIEMNKDEIFGETIRFKLSKSAPKTVIDTAQITDEYKYDEISTHIDKEKITADLKAGKEVKGAKLEPVFRFQDYPIKAAK